MTTQVMYAVKHKVFLEDGTFIGWVISIMQKGAWEMAKAYAPKELAKFEGEFFELVGFNDYTEVPH